jgi:nucleoside 2-deoxyribosyltransferase
MYKIYLAGPDVFYPDPIAHGQALCHLVRSYGHEPLFPLDNILPKDSENLSKKIFDANVNMIRHADVVLANLNEFRGHEPDSGTVWEIGFATGLNKTVIGYMDDTRAMVQKITGADDHYLDKDGFSIENFSHPLNLMLMHGSSAILKGGLVDALDYLKTITPQA